MKSGLETATEVARAGWVRVELFATARTGSEEFARYTRPVSPELGAGHVAAGYEVVVPWERTVAVKFGANALVSTAIRKRLTLMEIRRSRQIFIVIRPPLLRLHCACDQPVTLRR